MEGGSAPMPRTAQDKREAKEKMQLNEVSPPNIPVRSGQDRIVPRVRPTKRMLKNIRLSC
jgi:hypothetical protein